jgi:peptide deformylase
MKIVHYPDPILLQPTVPVTSFDEKIFYQVDKMFKIMKHQNGIGLAANQVGSSNSLFVFGVPFVEMVLERVFINPQIKLSGDIITLNEGCLSFPGVSVEVPRYSICNIYYQDIAGIHHEEIFQGLPAIVCQHEMDHLLGKTFIDNLPELTRDQIRAKILGNEKK